MCEHGLLSWDEEGATNTIRALGTHPACSISGGGSRPSRRGRLRSRDRTVVVVWCIIECVVSFAVRGWAYGGSSMRWIVGVSVMEADPPVGRLRVQRYMFYT